MTGLVFLELDITTCSLVLTIYNHTCIFPCAPMAATGPRGASCLRTAASLLLPHEGLCGLVLRVDKLRTTVSFMEGFLCARH